MHAREPEAFTALIAEVEQRWRRALRGTGRVRCLGAYIQSPAGFTRCLGEAERRARTRGPKGNPFGILLCDEGMLAAGEHLLGAPTDVPEPRQEDELHARVDEAPVERGPAPAVCTDCWVSFGSQQELADHREGDHRKGAA